MFNLLSPRTSIIVISSWIVIVVASSLGLKFTDSTFFQFGPSEHLMFFGNTINTWWKWTAIAGYTIINQLITTYGLETISPWMINEVQNKNNSYINMSRASAVIIIEIWYTYMWLGRIFGIHIFTTQIDFALIVLAADLTATYIVTMSYLKLKCTTNSTIDSNYIDYSGVFGNKL